MKMRLENPIDPLGEDPTKDKIETSRWEPTQQKKSVVGRPGGRPPTVGFSTVGKAVDRPVNRGSQTESKNSLSVDRPGRPKKTESTALAFSRPVGRPR